MSEYEDFILQKFQDQNGKLETPKQRECRLCWIKNDYPTYSELEKICNSTLKSIQNYSHRFNWKAIKDKALDLKTKAEVEELRERQRKTLDELDALNNQMILDLQNQLDNINHKLEAPDLTDKDAYLYRQEQREIIKTMKIAQGNKLRTVNLPEKINPVQDHKHTGEVEMNIRLKKYLRPSNITD